MGSRVKSKKTKNHEPGEKMKAVATTTTKAVAAPMQTGGFFSAPSASDIIIPKILPLHYMSAKVKDKNIEAAAGDMRDTLSNEKFGDTETPFLFVPIGTQKFWTVNKKAGAEFVEKIPWTTANQNLPREEGDLIRYLTYEVYILIPSKLKEGHTLPYVLSFRSTSQRAGRVLATKQFELAQMGLNFWDMQFELSVKEESNDKGDFFLQTVTPKGKSDQACRDEAAKWFKLMSSGSVQVKADDSDLTGTTGVDAVETTEY